MEPIECPDPIVTANIYCRGRLDDVIARCISPFWRMRETGRGEGNYLWMLRYLRRGEHLKVRIHATEERADELRNALDVSVRSYLASLGPFPAGEPSAADAQGMPAIDPEDEGNGVHPDREVVWTRYRRSPIVLGSTSLLDDDRYAALFTRAMGHCSESVLSALDGQGEVPFRARQTALLRLAVASLAGVEWSRGELARYLVYHRNWLLRHVLARAGHGGERGAELIALLHENARRWESARPAVARVVASLWPDEKGGAGSGPVRPRQQPSFLGQLARHVSDHGGDAGQPSSSFDPFAARSDFVPVFKVLHGSANQFGLKPLDEGFVYHFLLHVHAPEEDSGFAAQPAT
jgi:hypothetical protein